MSNPIDQAFERLKTIEGEIRVALAELPNESDTRLKALDRMLFEVFLWDRDAVFTEPHSGSGYIDYLLTVGEKRNALIIEAKRAGKLLPDSKSNALTIVNLAGPVAKPLLPAIKQALGYANEKGVAVAAVTDGETWLFFKASRGDGTPPLEGRGILFPNWNAIKDKFTVFFELVSSASIVDRRHLAHLNDAEGLSIPSAEQQYFVMDPSAAKMRVRDPLANDASLLFAQFFSRLSDEQDREMLRDCFVETNESRKADLELQKIMQKILNNISPLNTGAGGALQREIERTMQSKRSETVLLIGNKGSGKSTFVERFFDTVLPLSVRERCVLAQVDLGNYHGDPEKIVAWAILQLREALESGVCANNPPTYDELQGIFFKEYQRWSAGSRKPLYETNKDQFKILFGEHMENRRETQPDEYVRLLLDWASRAQGRLPCVVFDNTDQFPVEVQDAVYQLAHSLESAAPVFNIVPITDRTIWRLSKAGALQSYAAKSFYLPVPEAKEIISRRVKFLQSKLGAEPSSARNYFSRKGFQVEVNDLAMLAEAVEKVFVENDYISGLIGRLGNFDIRRMLKLAERVFLSPDIKIDDIIKSKFGGPPVGADKHRTHRALIKGEYDRFSEVENEFVSDLFYTSAQRPQSPLLAFYILWMLRHRAASNRTDNIEASHWSVIELCEYFDSCGVAEELCMQTIKRLYARRLIEALDPNLSEVGSADKIAIKESGIAHVELVLSSTVYLEQMALVTGVNEIGVRDEMRQLSRRPSAQTFIELRDIFLRYLLKVDAGRLSIPSAPNYAQLRDARRHVRNLNQLERRPAKAPFKTRGPSNSYRGKRRPHS